MPLDDLPVRVLTSHHPVCSGDTRVRLPAVVPAAAVRRVTCRRCYEPYRPAWLELVPDEPPWWRRSIAAPSWQWVTLPIAAVAVVAALLVLRGGGEADPAPSPTALTAGTPAQGTPRGGAERPAAGGKVPKDAQLISESTFQLALPPGWQRTAPSGGATFAAAAPGGEADVMLWIEQDPRLDFAAFEARSLAQLESLAGSAEVVQRNPGPTPETTSITIAPTSAPEGAPNYEVLLRASGDYWYYLATTSQAGASPRVADGIALVQGSFLPQAGAR